MLLLLPDDRRNLGPVQRLLNAMKHRVSVLFACLFPTVLSAQLGPEHRFVFPGDGTATGIHDLDGDGDGDILRASTAGLILHEQVSPDVFNIRGNLGPTEGVTSMSFGDLDGDGIDDVLLSFGTGTVAWVRLLGDGTYEPMSDLLDGLGEVADVRAVDLDEDLDLDLLVVLDPGTWQPSWAENLGGATFGPPQLITDEVFFDMADIDMDGDVDILVSGLQWLENDGNGSFTTHAIVTASGNAVLGDIDGDTDPDILLAGEYEVYRMLNDGTGTFGPQETAMLLEGAPPIFYEMKMGDREGDGDLDLYGWYGGHLGSHQQLITGINDGNGYFDFNLGLTFGSSDNSEPYALGSVNGDAATDVVSWSNDAFRLYYSSTGPGIRLNSVTGPVFLARHGSDIVVCGPAYFGPSTEGPPPLQLAAHAISGGEVSQMPQEWWVSASTIRRVDTADLDGIGGPDLIAQWSHSVSPSWRKHMLMSGSDSIGAIGNGFTAMGFDPVVPLIRDLDLDGDKDMAYCAGWSISVILQPFGAPEEHMVSTSFMPMGATLCNVDLDGYPDFVWAHADPDSIIWIPNDGTGAPGPVQYAQPSPISIIPSSGEVSPVLSAHDLDLDGLEDVIIFNGGSMALMRNTGGALSTLQTFPCDARAFAIDDMDGDGFPDVVASHWNGDVVAWLNLGNGMMGGPLTLATLQEPFWGYHLILTDINEDGAPDVVTCSPNGSAVWMENLFNTPYQAHGHVWHDANADGVEDPGEGPLPFILAACDPPYGFPMTDPNGAYSFALYPGLFTLSSLAPDTLWTLTSDSSQYHIEITDLDPVSTGNDFGYAPSQEITHLEPTMLVNTGVCSGISTIFLQAANLGTTIPDAHLTLQLDTAFSYISASIEPDSMNGQLIYWTLDSVYFYSSQGIMLTVNGPDTAMMGLPMSNTLTLEAIVDGTIEQTSAITWTNTITCSYDPNDKQVSPAGYGAFGAVDIATTYLDYTIRFQNTGTAPAVDVMIRDMLDPDLDPTSLVLLGHSHVPSDVHIRPDGILEFRFEGINLPDSGADYAASQGFVRYRIALDAGLANLTPIENTALIFFDLNAPVATNTVINTLVDCELFNAEISWHNIDSLVANTGDHYQWHLEGDSIDGANGQWLLVTEPGNYTVEVTDVYGCFDESDPYEVIITGLPENSVRTLTAVPNPASDRVTLTLSQPAQGDMALYDATGAVVQRKTWPAGSTSMSLDLRALEEGIYFVELVTTEGRHTVRVVRMQ